MRLPSSFPARLVLAFALSLLPLWGVLQVAQLTGRVPLGGGIRHASYVTDIRFPAGSRCERVYGKWLLDRTGILIAKVEMSRADFDAFRRQKGMGAWSPADAEIRQSSVREFLPRGWDTRGVQDLRHAHFSNGSFTNVVADLDAPDVVRVYVHYDEP